MCLFSIHVAAAFAGAVAQTRPQADITAPASSAAWESSAARPDASLAKTQRNEPPTSSELSSSELLISEPPDPELVERKQLAFQVGLIILVGTTAVCAIGMLIALVLGRRVRQLARTPLPAVSEPDAFWYLRRAAPAQQAPASEATDPPEESQ